MSYNLVHGDCLEEIPRLGCRFDLIYLDPPFATGTTQRSTTRDGSRSHEYCDRWDSMEDYLSYMRQRVAIAREALTDNGSIIYHCDRRTSHHARLLLESVFGEYGFRAEIIWTYKRWSNSKRGLMPGHQTLFWFSKGRDYIFNRIYTDYSPSTNVDQLLQMRSRDDRNKSVYATDENGRAIANGVKRGVPLSDVWDIPYLNPKAKERVGYPTQKPVLLLDRVIRLWSSAESAVLDPFCGSGTTLLAAQELKRTAIGIDISASAVELSRSRLEDPRITESRLLSVGRDAYRQADASSLAVLGGLDVTPVQRNKYVDAVLSSGFEGKPVLIRVQREGESIGELKAGLDRAARQKQAKVAFLVQTSEAGTQSSLFDEDEGSVVHVVPAPAMEVRRALRGAVPSLMGSA